MIVHKGDIMASLRRTARVAGLLYLLVAVFGFFGHFVARGTVVVPGDAAATAANIAANPTLVRLGVVGDLLMATAYILLGLVLFRLFRHVNREVAAALVVFVAIGTGMILLNLVGQYAALRVATDDTYAAALGRPGSDALTLVLVEMQSYGFSLAGVLFGLWLLPLGYLAYVSGQFPRPLGVVLMVACCSYLIDTVATFLVPGLPETFSTVVTLPAAVAELWMVGYLLTVGVRLRSQPSSHRTLVAGVREDHGAGRNPVTSHGDLRVAEDPL
jgi:hypothetical protein